MSHLTRAVGRGIRCSPQLHRFFSAAPTAGGKKFKVLGLQQVAIGGLDKSALSSFWEGHMGITKVGDYRSEVKECICPHCAVEASMSCSSQSRIIALFLRNFH